MKGAVPANTSLIFRLLKALLQALTIEIALFRSKSFIEKHGKTQGLCFLGIIFLMH